MSSRDQHGDVMRYLKSMNTKIEDVSKLTRQNNEELKRIAPRRDIQPIPRPKQGIQMARGASVTKYIRQYTVEKNAGKRDGDVLYEVFSGDIDDKQYNTDAMSCLEWILALHLGSDLGVKTWEQICKQSPAKMGLIIRDAMNAPELKVFAQSAGQWAIQMLITNKMNSRIRYNRCRAEQETSDSQQVNLAPATVPDLPGNAIPLSNTLHLSTNLADISNNAYLAVETGNNPAGSSSVTTPDNGIANTGIDNGGARYGPVPMHVSVRPSQVSVGRVVRAQPRANARGGGARSTSQPTRATSRGRGANRGITRQTRTRGASGGRARRARH